MKLERLQSRLEDGAVGIPEEQTPEEVSEAVAAQTDQTEVTVDAVEDEQQVEAADATVEILDTQTEEAEMLCRFIRQNGIDDTVLGLYNHDGRKLLDRCAGYSLPSSSVYVTEKMTQDVIYGLEDFSKGMRGLADRFKNTVLNGFRLWRNLLSLMGGLMLNNFRTRVARCRKMLDYVKHYGIDDEAYKSKAGILPVVPYKVAMEHVKLVSTVVTALPAAIKSVNGRTTGITPQIKDLLNKVEKAGVKVDPNNPRHVEVLRKVETTRFDSPNSGYANANAALSQFEKIVSGWEAVERQMGAFSNNPDNLAKELDRNLSDGGNAKAAEDCRKALQAGCYGINKLVSIYTDAIVSSLTGFKMYAGMGRDLMSKKTVTDFFD